MKHEYLEGKEAKERFETLAAATFRAPKSTVKPPVKRVRVPKKTSKD